MARSLGKNFLWSAGYQVLLVLVPLVTTPYLSRVLGAEQVGVYSYTSSITNYFVIFATLGMAQHGVRSIAQAGDNREARSHTFWSAWAAQLCVAIPVALIYVVYAVVAPAGGTLVAFIWGLWVLSAVLDVSWLFFGVEEFKLPTIRSCITKLAGVAVIFIFVKGPDDLWAYCLSLSGAFFANVILLWPFVKRYVDFIRPTWAEVRVHFIPNVRLFAPVVAISLYTAFDKILLGSISGMAEAGYYEYSEKLSKMPMAVITALGTVMLPHMTAKLIAGEVEGAKKLLRNSLWAMEAAAMGLAFGIAVIAPEFVPVFFGDGYEPCASIMPVVAIVIPIIAASNVIGVQYMLPMRLDRHYTLSVCVGAVVNVILCLLLLKPFGAFGCAIATVLTELSVLGYQCFIVRCQLPLGAYLRDALPFVVCGALMYVVVRAIVASLAATIGVGWPLLGLEIVIGVVVYCAFTGIWCWRSGRLRDMVKLMRSR